MGDLSPDASDAIRTVILMVGFALAMLAAKFAYLAIRNGEGARAYGLASYALMVITPAIISLFRYEEPLVIPAAITYVAGLVTGIYALRSILVVLPEWTRIRAADRRRRRDRRHRRESARDD